MVTSSFLPQQLLAAGGRAYIGIETISPHSIPSPLMPSSSSELGQGGKKEKEQESPYKSAPTVVLSLDGICSSSLS